MKCRLAIFAGFFVGVPQGIYAFAPFSHQNGNISAKNYYRYDNKNSVSWENCEMKLFESPNSEVKNNNERQINVFNSLMITLPVSSLIFPTLLNLAKSLPPNSSKQLAVVTALFVSNRVYLYMLSATIVGLAAMRGSGDSPQLGQRITDLTEELLYRPSLKKEKGDDYKSDKPAVIRNIKDSGLKESLDQVSNEAQAVVLPILVSILLALSVFSIPLWNKISGVTLTDETNPIFDIQELISKILPQISQVWYAFLLALFTRSEVRRLDNEFGVVDYALLEWTVAVGVTCLAFFYKVWVAQNFVNMALAILVARAIQLGNFPAIMGALTLLTIYDVSSVFLIPAANAWDMIADSQGSLMIADASPAASAMGSVAMQKLTSGNFQPGLLVTKIGNQLGGSLGLGDAVFPSLLSTFVRRFDMYQDGDDRVSLFAVSIAGYLIGCFACEFAPLISTSGLPALIFIIPSMLGAVLVASFVSGELAELWEFDPNVEK